MNLIWWVLIIACWLACGVLQFGLSFAYFQRQYRRIADEHFWDDFISAVFYVPFGPISLMVQILIGGVRHGVKFNLKREGISYEEWLKSSGY